ncbi:ABC transporter ATP-binding protein [Intrasporangium sp.]|uniref:ABC transporter ATP-binding protein n=1 Tax=Intrasporangium sp. TaxID=1925024 RepID=UPI002939F637|nr:ABC transporter ATP-binding protein [Intrasporangium sp.]MDV3220291.1 ABC transporter ATP-binding protein [Intrasporangium sp.]
MLAAETRELTKRYGELAAVDGVNLTVHEGEIYGFLGPNGAGKTTTLRMLLGLVRPTSGSVRIKGRDPAARGTMDEVGALIEGPAFYPYLSARKNLVALSHHAGVPADHVEEALHRVGLTDRAGSRFDQFSLGMKQRLGIAAALLKRPRMLVLDEPTNGLDPAGMVEIRELLRELRTAGVTVLLSSHVLAEVEQICDRVGILVEGRLLAESSVDALRGEAGTLVIEATPLAEAASVARNLLGHDTVAVRQSSLHLTAAAQEAARVNAALVRADVQVHRLAWREPDLEETFLRLTGGGGDRAL